MTFSRVRRVALAATTIASATLLAACGGSDAGSTGSQTSTAPATTTATAAAALVPAPPTSPPAFPGEDVLPPLPERPPTGKKVAYLECEVKDCADIKPGFQAAVETLGWTFEVIPAKLQSPGSAVQRAIQSGVDYIAITASPRALFEQELKAANAAGIKVFSTSDPTPPDPQAGLMAQIADGASLASQNAMLADWIINQSDGKAQVAYVTIPDLPIIDAGRAGFEDEITSKCPTCGFKTIEVTLEDLGKGTIPAQVIAHLQRNPDTTDLVYAFFGAYIGSDAALKAAGSDVRATVLADGPPEEIVNGEMAASTVQGNQYLGWAAVDQMARVATDSYSSEQERKAATIPAWVLASKDQAQKLVDEGAWPGPEGFEEDFKRLWKVDG